MLFILITLYLLKGFLPVEELTCIPTLLPLHLVACLSINFCFLCRSGCDSWNVCPALFRRHCCWFLHFKWMKLNHRIFFCIFIYHMSKHDFKTYQLQKRITEGVLLSRYLDVRSRVFLLSVSFSQPVCSCLLTLLTGAGVQSFILPVNVQDLFICRNI